MIKISDEFPKIFTELEKLRGYVQLLEQELASERQARIALQQTLQSISERAQLIAEEATRGEPFTTQDGTALNLIDNSVGKALSLHLAAVEARPTEQIASLPSSDWLTAGPANGKHDAAPDTVTQQLTNSLVAFKD